MVVRLLSTGQLGHLRGKFVVDVLLLLLVEMNLMNFR